MGLANDIRTTRDGGFGGSYDPRISLNVPGRRADLLIGADGEGETSSIAAMRLAERNTRNMAPENRVYRGPHAYGVLEQAYGRHARLQVRVDSTPPSCETRIRSLYPHSNRMDIDTFGVPEKDTAMDMEVPVEVSMVLNHVPYRFTTHSLALGRGIAHGLAIPQEIEVVQRRAYFRMEPPDGQSIQVGVQYRSQEDTRTVDALNMSLGGILIYDRLLVAAPEDGHPLLLTLQFEDGEGITVKGIVRRAAPHPNIDRGLQIGIRFERVSPGHELTLNQMIMRWQREARRRKLGEE